MILFKPEKIKYNPQPQYCIKKCILSDRSVTIIYIDKQAYLLVG